MSKTPCGVGSLNLTVGGSETHNPPTSRIIEPKMYPPKNGCSAHDPPTPNIIRTKD